VNGCCVLITVVFGSDGVSVSARFLYSSLINIYIYIYIYIYTYIHLGSGMDNDVPIRLWNVLFAFLL
jgi:hypothetical protein